MNKTCSESGDKLYLLEQSGPKQTSIFIHVMNLFSHGDDQKGMTHILDVSTTTFVSSQFYANVMLLFAASSSLS